MKSIVVKHNLSMRPSLEGNIVSTTFPCSFGESFIFSKLRLCLHMTLPSQFDQFFMMVYLSWFRQFLHMGPLDPLFQDLFVLLQSNICANCESDTHIQWVVLLGSYCLLIHCTSIRSFRNYSAFIQKIFCNIIRVTGQLGAPRPVLLTSILASCFSQV